MQDIVSIIIVNYNSDRYLKFCVESCLNSTLQVELIIVDNGSTDNSLIQLKPDPRVTIVKNQHNLGFARANNQALHLARGDDILFLNPDCEIKPSTLAHMLEVMTDYPTVGMAGCRILNSDGSEQAGCRRRIPTPRRLFSQLLNNGEPYLQHHEPLPDTPTKVEAISGAFMLVRKSALAKVGPMDEKFFMHCEDLDWCIRFREAGFDILFVPSIEITHAKGICSQARPIAVEWHKHKGMVSLYRKHFAFDYSPLVLFFFSLAVWSRFYFQLPSLIVKYAFRNRHRYWRQ